MKNRGGLRQRLGRAFLLQAVLISIAAVIGVYAAAFTIEEVLVKRALEEEATYFWGHFEGDASFPLPDTRNLTGYLAPAGDPGTLPEALGSLAPGFHHLPTQADFSVVYVTERGPHRLYLVFDGESVGRLAVPDRLVRLSPRQGGRFTDRLVGEGGAEIRPGLGETTGLLTKQPTRESGPRGPRAF
jgi:hypothetical protein